MPRCTSESITGKNLFRVTLSVLVQSSGHNRILINMERRDGWTVGWMDGWMDGQIHIDIHEKWVNGCVDR